MGSPIINPLILDPGKWYCVTVERWLPLFPHTGCDDFNPGELSCCGIGQDIINWVNAGNTCVVSINFCPRPANECQRIVGVKGPYDAAWQCLADCP